MARLSLARVVAALIFAIPARLFSQCYPTELEATLSAGAQGSGFAAAIGSGVVAVAAPLGMSGPHTTASVSLYDADTGERLKIIYDHGWQNAPRFGWSVAISGSLLAATLELAEEDGSGAVRLIDIPQGTLSRSITIPNTPPGIGSFSDPSIAMEGSLLLVGVPNDSTSCPQCGIAYLFDANSGILLQTFSDPKPDSYGAGDQFGSSVAFAGDKVVIGAPEEDFPGAPAAGAAYLFDSISGSLLASFASPSTTESAQFGAAVAGTESVVAVGAPRERSGLVYLFDPETGAHIRSLGLPGASSQAQFGGAIALDGDLAIIGARRDSRAGTISGAAFIFQLETGIALRYIKNPTPEEDDHFGAAVALGAGVALVGAPSDSTFGQYRGTAYLFRCLRNASSYWLLYE